MGAGDRRAALLGVEGDRQQGKEGGACHCEMGRPEQRLWKWADGGWHSVAPPSCEEAQGHSLSQLLQWGGSRGASGRWWSSTDALEQTQESFPSKAYSSKHSSTQTCLLLVYKSAPTWGLSCKLSLSYWLQSWEASSEESTQRGSNRWRTSCQALRGWGMTRCVCRAGLGLWE